MINQPSIQRLEQLTTISSQQIRYVTDSPLFTQIYRRFRALITAISIPDTSPLENENAILLHMELTKLLISPRLPSQDIFKKTGLSDQTLITRKWGFLVWKDILKIQELISNYKQSGSLLNNQFVNVYCDLLKKFEQEKIKICCHKNEKSDYIKILSDITPLKDGDFICNLTDYRENSLIEALMIYGPLRLFGMARKPEIIALSPIYNNLVRFTWHGVTDDAEFGLDPIDIQHNYLSSMPLSTHLIKPSYTEDLSITLPIEELHTPQTAIADNLILPIKKGITDISCALIELPNDSAILLRPKSHTLIFSLVEQSQERIRASSTEDLKVGDYYIDYDLYAGLGKTSVNAVQFPLAVVWKDALSKLYASSPNICVMRMKSAGIDLKDLYRAANSWMHLGDSVISAPKNRLHFKALIEDVLDKVIPPSSEGSAGWERAYHEVEKSRESAIEHGVIKSSIIQDRLIEVLRKNLTRITQLTSTKDVISTTINSEDFNGSIRLQRIITIANSYSAPPEQLERQMSLAIAEQYSKKLLGL